MVSFRCSLLPPPFFFADSAIYARGFAFRVALAYFACARETIIESYYTRIRTQFVSRYALTFRSLHCYRVSLIGKFDFAMIRPTFGYSRKLVLRIEKVKYNLIFNLRSARLGIQKEGLDAFLKIT